MAAAQTNVRKQDNLFNLTIWVAAIALTAAYVVGAVGEPPSRAAPNARGAVSKSDRRHQPAQIAARESDCPGTDLACRRPRR